MPIKLNGTTNGSIELNVPDAVGSDLQMTLPATAGEIVVKDSSGLVNVTGGIQVTENVTPTTGSGVEIFKPSSTAGQMQAFDRSGSAWMDLIIKGNTQQFHANGSERMRIDSSGKVGIGTSSPYNVLTGKTLSIGDGSNSSEITLLSGTTSSGALWFGDATSGTGSYAGSLEYSHNGDYMRLSTAATERMRIDSSGRLMLGTTTAGWTSFGDMLTIHNNSHCGMTLRGGETSDCEIFFADGTGGTSRYRGGIRYAHNTDHMQFTVNASEKMRIDSSGRLLIGTTTATVHGNRLLEIGNTSRGSTYATITTSTSGTGGLLFADSTTNDTGGYRGIIDYAHSLDAFRFYTASVERMRIESGGSVVIGASSSVWSNDAKVSLRVGSDSYFVSPYSCASYNRTGGNGPVMNFYRTTGNNVGNISVTTTNTSYNTTSDYRLKENISDLADGITRVKQLQPRRFNFIVEPDETVDGFIAHEAQTVVPEAVTGEKDGEEMQGIDQAKLVPLLTAALKEAITKIETLETKVAALEATS